ncbi:MAG: SDR family oxidoreductase [Flavobacteriales bacterium]|nr:MAG: SDR family oxidoreductase [Flavobacteriales bacterium]
MDIQLTGQRALVLGASQGIGRAVALELAALGASIIAVARDRDRLESVLAELPSSNGSSHRYLVLDLLDTAALSEAMKRVAAEAPVHIVVNNSGGPPPGPAHEAGLEGFETAFRQHLMAFQAVALAIVPGMKQQRHGRLINIISTSVKQPLHNLGVSNTVRGAVANWGKTMANELGPHGITVNNVLPGATRTERLTAIIRGKSAKQGISEAAAAAEMEAEIPLRRFAEPQEIAAAVAFLAGPSGGYINGINLPVDGGRTACL